MSRRPGPLPADLPDEFAVAEALRRGLSRDRLGSADLTRPHHGVRARAEPDDIYTKARALATVLGEGVVFSHHTAAALLCLPAVYTDGDLHVTTSSRTCRVQRPGVVGHRATPSGVYVVRGLTVTNSVVTWADLAGSGSVDDSVALGDTIESRTPGAVRAMRQEIDRRHGGRGVVTMRAAIELIRGGESVMETRARLLMHWAGLPAPELNRDVIEDGAWLACPDFSWPRLKVAVEYDGDHHRSDRAQWRRDIARRRLLEAAGWRIIVITAEDVLRFPSNMITLVRSALVEAACRAR